MRPSCSNVPYTNISSATTIRVNCDQKDIVVCSIMESQQSLSSDQTSCHSSLASTDLLLSSHLLLSSQVLELSIQNPPPLYFTRINRQRHILYNSQHAQDFIAWWTTTICGRQNQETAKFKIRGTGAKVSPHWKNFEQVADVATGEAGIRCQLCHKILHHPHTANTGTTNMGIHTSLAGCRQSWRSTAQVDLTTMLDLVSNAEAFHHGGRGNIER